ncbi:radical SAM protein [Mesorhizobium sp. M0910]|uniref:radical SAM protein n=1 Tax=Mesorhizobium sp. M0910 TaxID=2957025 RepID=UPI00333A2BC4
MSAPRVSFVSLGCPKALVDSERIITRLRAEGYEIARKHDGADLVVVNTCGFLDSARDESLNAIGSALSENGRVIVTGCLGAEPDVIRERHPNVLAITGPQAYESDREVRAKFLDLSEELGKLGVWVRMHYVYPYPHVADVIPLMAEGKILPYLDIPFQHASPQVLKNMRRPAHGEKTLERIRSWRDVCPDLAIRSTFIVGFPGETDDDFEMLLDWLDEAKIDRAGCFKYEPVRGARSNELGLEQVPQEIKEARWHRFMQRQQKISATQLTRKIGKRLPVLIDEAHGNSAKGRTKYDAPEIDGSVHIQSRRPLRAGDIVTVKIDRADAYDLYGSAV